MLEEPYRWVEAINNRREYVEDQLASGSPVVGTTYADGVLLLTATPGPRKLFEVYDEIAFAAVGHRLTSRSCAKPSSTSPISRGLTCRLTT